MAKAQSEFNKAVTPDQIGSASSRLRVFALNLLWVVLLGVFILAGTRMASFHGDEAMQITMSEDYVTAFLQGQLGALAVMPPYVVDSSEWLRLINGSVNRYAIGFSWHVSGIDFSELPDVWQWPLSYEENVARGNRPSDEALLAARIPSALFLALSAAVMFGVGSALGGRGLAYIASGLYAVNPVILLNGRRAMQEGSFLFFGLLAVWFAILISQHYERVQNGRGTPRPYRVGLWAGLILASAFTLASKHSGVVFVAAAFGWVGVSAIISLTSVRDKQFFPQKPHPPTPSPFDGEGELSEAQRGEVNKRALTRTDVSLWSRRSAGGLNPRLPEKTSPLEGLENQPVTSLLLTILKLIVSGVLVIVVFVALSPALRNDPIARLGDLVDERGKLLESQIIADPDAPTTLAQRIEGIITQPFIAAPVHYEAVFWGNAVPIQNEIAAYMASPLSGLQAGVLLGLPLTLLVGLGLIQTILGHGLSRVVSWGLVFWAGITIINLLVNPLPWQRYYLPLYPVATLLAGIGLLTLMQFVQKRLQPKSPLAGA